MTSSARLLLLGVGLFFLTACTQQPDDSPVYPSNPSKGNVSEWRDQVMSGGGTQGLTLAQVDACPYTDLVPVPAGYVLARAGIWSYSAAYLLIHKATGRRIGEVYENCLVNGGEVCNLDWQSTENELCCDDGGSNCTSEYSHDDIFMLVKC